MIWRHVQSSELFSKFFLKWNVIVSSYWKRTKRNVVRLARAEIRCSMWQGNARFPLRGGRSVITCSRFIWYWNYCRQSRRLTPTRKWTSCMMGAPFRLWVEGWFERQVKLNNYGDFISSSRLEIRNRDDRWLYFEEMLRSILPMYVILAIHSYVKVS